MERTPTALPTLGLNARADGAADVPGDLVMSFRELCETHLPRVYGYVRYRVVGPDAADEVTALVFLKAATNLRGFDPARGAMETWLYAIARNSISDYFRSQRRWKLLPLDWLAQRPATQPGPELEAINDELQRALARALSRLSARERDVLGLKFGAGLTNRAIVDVTGLKESHVAVIVHRAIGKLRAQLEAKGVRRA